MSSPSPLEARIEQLETTLAFQEQTIDELTEALAGHYREIEGLKREMGKLAALLAQMESHPALSGEAEPPPPHY